MNEAMMRLKQRFRRIAIFAMLFAPGAVPCNVSGQTLRQVAKFDLPGPDGKRFDYLTIDDADRYLLSAHSA